MEDYQAELLAIYAEISYELISRVTFAVNQLGKEYISEEMEDLRKIKEMVKGG